MKAFAAISKNRLELTNFFEAVDRVFDTRHFDFAKYNSEKLREDLKVIRDHFGLDYPMGKLIEDHKEFVRILSLPNNRQRFANNWFKSMEMKVWDMLGVIESFHCESFVKLS